MAPITGDKTIGKQMAMAIDMTGCCDKKKHSSIATAPLLLELSENSKKKFIQVLSQHVINVVLVLVGVVLHYFL